MIQGSFFFAVLQFALESISKVLYVPSNKELYIKPFSMIFVVIFSRKIKVNAVLVFRHLVEVMAVQHTSKVLKSCLKTLNYMQHSCLVEQVVEIFLAFPRLSEHVCSNAEMKKWVKEGRKNTFLHNILSILIIAKVK